MLNVRRILTLAAVIAAGAVFTGGRVLAVHDGNRAPVSPSQQTPPSQPPAGQTGSEPQRGFGPGPGRGPGQDVRAWWKDPDMAKEVGLTTQQIAKIDRIYETRQLQIRTRVDEYNTLKSELDRLIRERTAKPAEVEAQARRLMYPRLDIDVSRTKMLYEMSLVMSADQNNKMRAMFDRLDQERRAVIERYEHDRRRGRGGNFHLP